MRDAFRVLGGNEPDWGGLVTERGRVMGIPRLSRRLLTAIVPVVLFALLAIPAASANANHQATGRGTTTEFICANGVPNVATIQFSATKSKGVLSGFYQIIGSSVSKQ